VNEGPEAILEFSVLDESEDYIIIAKPAPLIVHPSNGRVEPTLLCGLEGLLAFEIANGHKPAIITRLDRETSGLVLVAKHTDAARQLAMSLQNRRAEKEYIAIVHGHPEWEEIEVDQPIIRQGLVQESAIWLKRTVHPQGRESFTQFRCLRRWENARGRFSEISCLPLTGRTHQIRVHLAHLGYAIVGDKIYGAEESTFLEFIETGWTEALRERMMLPRQALHALRLSLPWQGQVREWSCPLARDMIEFRDGTSDG
jgi:23S rRNA pseudouridine1911/1915/1917 synthase